MGLFEKRRFKNFLVYVQDFNQDDPKTWKDMNPNVTTMKQVYDKFGLDPNTQDFTGHALALYRLPIICYFNNIPCAGDNFLVFRRWNGFHNGRFCQSAHEKLLFLKSLLKINRSLICSKFWGRSQQVVVSKHNSQLECC
jgi:hypothetical protein